MGGCVKTDGVKYIGWVLEGRGKLQRRDFTFEDLMTFEPKQRAQFIRDYYYVLDEFDSYDNMIFLSRSQIEKAIFAVTVNEKTHQSGVWAMEVYNRCVEEALKQVDDEITHGQAYIRSAAKILERLKGIKS